jgi:hypothetical protein
MSDIIPMAALPGKAKQPIRTTESHRLRAIASSVINKRLCMKAKVMLRQ